MSKNIYFLLLPLIFLLNNCVQSQESKKASQTNNLNRSGDIAVGGYCDNCEIMYEGIPSIEKILPETSIANNNEPGQKLDITGTIYKKDGITPAKNIILYIYHTDASGYYRASNDQTDGKRNGRLRGWVKSNDEGFFSFHTIRPAPYPDSNFPAHIHIYVKEPKITLYYIDEIWFDDDPFITAKLKDAAEKRGGDQIIHLTKNQDNGWNGTLKIVLGLNIPGYQ